MMFELDFSRRIGIRIVIMVIIMLIQNENDNYIKHYGNHDDVDKDDDGYYITLSCPKIQGISFLLLRFFYFYIYIRHATDTAITITLLNNHS